MKPSEPLTTRLNKRLVELGLADSRRKADYLINSGQVKINGKDATIGSQVGHHDKITLLGQTGLDRPDISIKFYKPSGYICSHLKNSRSKTIFELLPKAFSKLKIAGRLDRDSKGLMILSSDGHLIQYLSHPSSGKEKEYLVTLTKPFEKTLLKSLVNGVKLDDGISRFVRSTLVQPAKLRVVLAEGRNRQIRRTFEKLGYKVAILERTRIGKTTLGTLTSGKYEFIKEADIRGKS